MPDRADQLLARVVVAAGLVGGSQVQECLAEIERLRRRGTKIDLGRYLVDRGLIARQDLERAMAEAGLATSTPTVIDPTGTAEPSDRPGARPRLADPLADDPDVSLLIEAVELGWLSPEQAEQCLHACLPGQIEGYLVRGGYLAPERIAELRNSDVKTESRLFGEIAIARGLVTHEQLRIALEEQAKSPIPLQLGQIFIKKGWLGIPKFLEVLQEQRVSVWVCQECDRRFTIRDVKEAHLLRCLRCGGKLQAGEAIEYEPAPGSSRGSTPLPGFRPGRRVGRYVLVREVGRGGMGVVFEAQDPQLRRRVALKVIASDSTSADDVRRLYREATIAARLRHSSIATVYEVGMEGGIHFIAIEFIECGSVAERLSREGPLEPRDAVGLIERVARAIHASHELGIVHRDLKPGNILLDGQGRPVVTDFGMAQTIEKSVVITRSGTVMGTPGYMAPEQILGNRKENEKLADIWALGAILHELLTGKRPFEAASIPELFQRILTQDPPPLRRVSEGEGDSSAPASAVIDRSLETIVGKCLQKDAERRYSSAGELAEDLACWLDGDSIQARPPSPLSRAWSRIRGRPLALALGTAVAVPMAILGLRWYVSTGTLSLQVRPADARIAIGDETWTAGEDPLSIELPPGHHVVRVEAPDHVAQEREILLERGGSKELSIGLDHHRGLLEALCEPSGSDLSIDGQSRGSQLLDYPLDTGVHRLHVRAPGYFERRQEVRIERDRKTRTCFSLDRAEIWRHQSQELQSKVILLPDLDGDGGPELALQMLHDLAILSAVTGETLSRRFVSVQAGWVVSLEDLGGDVGQALVLGSEMAGEVAVACLPVSRAMDQDYLWTWVGPSSGQAIHSPLTPRVIEDRTGDGIRELAACGRDGVLSVLDGRTGQEWRRLDLPGRPFLSVPALEPTSGGSLLFAGLGAEPYVGGTGGARPAVSGCIRLDDGQTVWSRPIREEGQVSFGDVDGDGAVDLLWCAKDSWVLLRGQTGEVLAEGALPRPEHSWIASLADLDGEGCLDLLLFEEGKQMLGVESAGGRTLWEVRGDLRLRRAGDDELLLALGPERLILCPFEDALVALDPASGKVVWRVPGRPKGACLADTDGDGTPEIVIGVEDVGLVAVDIHGAPLWTIDLDVDATPRFLVEDMDKDGFPEILARRGASLVGLFRGGPRILWSRQAMAQIQATPIAIDTDGDGTIEVIQVADWGKGQQLQCFEGATGVARWSRAERSPRNRPPAVADWDGDGRPDVVWLATAADDPSLNPRWFLTVHRGADGEILHSVPIEMQREYYATGVVEDLDGDGGLDFAVSRWVDTDVAAIDGPTGRTLWRHVTGGPNMGGLAVADLDGNGRPDIVAPSIDGHVYALSGDHGTVLWKRDVGPGGSRSPPTLLDLSEDGVADVLVISSSNEFWAIDGRTGGVLSRLPLEGMKVGFGRPVAADDEVQGPMLLWPLGKGSGVGAVGIRSKEIIGLWRGAIGSTVTTTPVVSDLDHDGRSEVVVGTSDGQMIVLDLRTGGAMRVVRLGQELIEADPVPADLDGDGIEDVLIADHGFRLTAVSGRGILPARRRLDGR